MNDNSYGIFIKIAERSKKSKTENFKWLVLNKIYFRYDFPIKRILSTTKKLETFVRKGLTLKWRIDWKGDQIKCSKSYLESNKKYTC